MRTPLFRFAITLLLSLIVFVASPSLHANMANPVSSGDVVGEPSMVLDSLRVLHERLAIDLRPLAQNDRAVVDAVYRIRNIGKGRRLRMLFIAVGLRDATDSTFLIELDGFKLNGVVDDTAFIPETWRAPGTTPALGGGEAIPFAAGGRPTGSGTKAVMFNVDLTTGVHSIHVRYRADGGTNSSGRMVLAHQFVYILAPARQWGGFDSLDAVVYLPHDWQAAVQPALKPAGGSSATGDSLVGSWADVPSAAIAMTVSMSPPPESSLTMTANVAIGVAGLVATILAIVAGVFVGPRLRRRRWSIVLVVPFTVVIGIVAASLVIGAHAWGSERIDSALGNQRARNYGRQRAINILVIGLPVAGVFAALVAGGVALVARRRAMRSDA